MKRGLADCLPACVHGTPLVNRQVHEMNRVCSLMMLLAARRLLSFVSMQENSLLFCLFSTSEATLCTASLNFLLCLHARPSWLTRDTARLAASVTPKQLRLCLRRHVAPGNRLAGATQAQRLRQEFNTDVWSSLNRFASRVSSVISSLPTNAMQQ